MLFAKLFKQRKSLSQLKSLAISRDLKKKELPLKQLTMIEHIVENAFTPVHHVLTPRVDVTAFEMNTSKQNLKTMAISSAYSRFPMYDDSIDNVKGILHINDLFQYVFAEKDINAPKRRSQSAAKTAKLLKADAARARNGSGENSLLRAYMSEPIFIPRMRGIFDVLGDLQLNAQQMAIVVDEYGGFSGLVTMEDILEEIIGEVRDESDEETDSIIEISPNRFSVDARTPLDELQKALQVDFNIEEAVSANTIGGFVINMLGYVPEQGSSLTWQNLSIKIKVKQGRSLKRLSIKVSKESGGTVSAEV